MVNIKSVQVYYSHGTEEQVIITVIVVSLNLVKQHVRIWHKLFIFSFAMETQLILPISSHSPNLHVCTLRYL